MAELDDDPAVTEWERSHTAGATLDVLAQEESRVDAEAHAERHSTAAGRTRATVERLATAAGWDEVARARDLSADARDSTALERDRAAEAVDDGSTDDAGATLKAVRTSAASGRQKAAEERAAAAADRAAAAADRERAASDRRHGGLDELTGVFRRGTGDLALTHEIARARRLGRPLVMVIADVDALKAVNDNEGHAAGDALLGDVVMAITSTMRSYDVTVRWGGDEFVCALSDVTLEVAAGRLGEIERSLDSRRPGASISAGLAALEEADTLESLLARADTALYRVKSNR